MTTAHIGLLPALSIAAAVAFAGWSVGQGVERFRMADRSVTVKGLAEQDVSSDFAVWTLGRPASACAWSAHSNTRCSNALFAGTSFRGPSRLHTA